MNKRLLLLTAIFIVGVVIYWNRERNPMAQKIPQSRGAETSVANRNAIPEKAEFISQGTVKQIESQASTPPSASASPNVAPAPKLKAQKENKKENAFPYVLEDGVAVVQGDWVVGTPVQKNADATGWVEIPVMRLWENPVIPYHIDPGVQNPERVRRALEMFEGTAVQFIPFSGQKDAIVFVDGTGTCKSYVGKVGGHQPIWVPTDCSSREVAHEVMHALGFVHEQNRQDRDQFIQVHYDDIDENFHHNFEKLPADFMKASGKGQFDFESLMIYPAWMFAKSGKATMTARFNQQINPSNTLSPRDIERLNRLYPNQQ